MRSWVAIAVGVVLFGIASGCGSSSPHADEDSGAGHAGAPGRGGDAGQGGDASGGSDASGGRAGGGSSGASGTGAGGAQGGTGGGGGDAGAGGEAGSDGPTPLPDPLTFFREPVGGTLDAVWGSDATDVYAVGYDGAVAHGPGDGTWTRENPLTTRELYSVWGSSATDVYASGAGGLVAHATGAGSWTNRDSPNTRISAPIYQVFGFDEDNVFLAAGSLWRGSLRDGFEEVESSPPVNGVWGMSPDDLYTVATTTLTSPNIHHLEPDGRWRAQATTGEYMDRVYGFDATHIYAIGSRSVWFSQGDGVWRAVLTLTDDSPRSLWGRDGLMYVGTTNGVLYVSNGVEWTVGQAIAAGTARPRIEGIWGSSHTDLYLATSSGLYHGTPTGTPGDGGTGGSGGTGPGGSFSTDPADFYGASRCGTSQAFCQDFESDTLPDYFFVGDEPTIDASRAARGTRSLHIVAAGGFASSVFQLWEPFPLPRNTFWIRLFVYFAALPTDVGPWTLIRAHTVPSAASYVSLGGYSDGSTNVLMHSLSSPYVALRDMDSSSDIPVGEWLCLEWLNDGAADEARLFWNNVERPSLHATPALTSTLDPGNYSTPEFDFLEIGWGSTRTGPWEMWLDEIAISSERIGCEN
jgi:hypothetical protein